MTARRLTSLVVPATLCALTALCPGDQPPASPKTLADVLPSGAAALLEVDDLRALLKRWTASKLHERFADSHAAADLEKSRLYLRLAQNVGQLEEVAGFGITLERLTQLAGRRSAIALYDVPATSFVLVMELGRDEAKRSDLLGQKGRLAQREHRGVKYLLAEGGRGKAPLAVALVGDRLIAGTDIDAFRGALVLAARAAGHAPPPVASGDEPQPITEDSDVAALFADAPRGAPIRLWVAQKRLTGTHYFDDYWIFGKASADGIESALVTLAPGDDVTVETRVYLYPAGARPAVAEDAAVDPGHADVVAAVAALPSSPPFASAAPADAKQAALILEGLLPRAGASEGEADPTTGLAEALAPGKPLRTVETVEPAHPKGGFAEHHGAVAIALGAPNAIDGKSFEAALAAAVGPRLVGGTDLAFTDEPGVEGQARQSGLLQGPTRALKLPLVTEWSLAWRRVGDAIVVGTDPAACRRLADALAQPATAKLLAPSAPRLYRLDVDRAATTWRDVTRTLAARQNWSDNNDAELFQESLGGLFDVAKETRRVVALGYARGPRRYVEEVQYRGVK
jgi:hypothetical protein